MPGSSPNSQQWNQLPSRVQRLIKQHKLMPHPEGGYFGLADQRHMDSQKGQKILSTKIYYLMIPGQGYGSRLHRLLARSEEWSHLEGDPIDMLQITPQGKAKRLVIGKGSRQSPLVTVPADTWQGARVKQRRVPDKKGYALVTCTVTPGFDPEQFEMADQPQIQDFLHRYGKNPQIKRMLHQLEADLGATSSQ